MPVVLGPTRVLVAPDTVRDARLALYHRVERWLAVADVHFGYEVSQRAAGALFPMWGMDGVEDRLRTLVEAYRPAQLIVAGDFVHNRDARTEAAGLVRRLREMLGGNGELVLVAGNHDRRTFARGTPRNGSASTTATVRRPPAKCWQVEPRSSGTIIRPGP